MRPKAAATPTATTPDPYSRPKASIVAAAALDDEEDGAVEPVLVAAVAVGVAEAEELLVDEAAAVKLVVLRVPQLLSRFVVQTFWAAASFSPATIQF
jgi:hypothetical protein